MTVEPIRPPAEGSTTIRKGLPGALIGGYETLKRYGYRIYMDPRLRQRALIEACQHLGEIRVKKILWKMYHRNQRPRVKDIIFSDIVWLERRVF